MKVKLFPADESGCGHSRMIFPGVAVQNSGVDGVEVDIVHDYESDDRHLVAHFDGPINMPHVSHIVDPECDVLVLQRPMSRMLVEGIPHIQKHGVAVVVEVDDDFESVHPKNPAWKAVNPRFSPEHNCAWFRLATQLCDLLIVSTPALLKRYGARGNGVVIPNYVPEKYLKVDGEHTHLAPVIGWAGSPHSHPDDLEVTRGSIPEVMKETHARFETLGHRDTLKRLKLSGTELALRTEVHDWVDIDEYPEQVAQFDIGIAPLANSPFNRAKSALKGLEYAALGVPFVASRIDEFTALHRAGIGELADHPTDWKAKLRRLVNEDDWRAERAAEGREIVASMTYENHVEEWLNAWSMARTYRDAR